MNRAIIFEGVAYVVIGLLALLVISTSKPERLPGVMHVAEAGR